MLTMNLFMLCRRHVLLPLGTIVLCVMGIAGTALAGDVEALYQAAGEGKSAEVVSLLESGVNVNDRTSSGSYALNAAAVENEVDVIRVLLDRGADPNVQNSQGDTPLICATKYAGGKAATLELLVKGGTDLGMKDNKGNTALDYAKAKGQQEAISMLEGSLGGKD
jgi:ankyrin repeat protein